VTGALVVASTPSQHDTVPSEAVTAPDTRVTR
jgi:hypothetical protein